MYPQAVKSFTASLGEIDCGTVPNALHNPTKILSASWRIRCFILEKVFSIGLKSGLHGGRYSYLIPARLSASRTAAVFCAERFSMIRRSPGLISLASALLI
jgi:hypothetical protein